MKLNNKGFAISTLLYGLIVIIVLIAALIVNIMAFNRSESKDLVDTVTTELETFEYQLDPYVVAEYDYTGTYQTFTVPHKGQYKLELWGAQGGGSNGGPGGYAVGTINLNRDDIYYVYVGGQGSQSASFGGNGYNGGGVAYAAFGGGGMTHISKVNTDSFNPTGSTKVITTATYPAQTLYQTISYQGKTAGSSWSNPNNKNWTVTKQFTASATSSVSFTSTSSEATSHSIDPVCRIVVNGAVKVQDDDGGSGYNFNCTTTVNAGDTVSYEVSSFRDTGASTSTVITLPARSDQQTTIEYADNAVFSPNNVIILAGGGGGTTSSTTAKGGSGGGYQSGQTMVQSKESYSYSANQSSGYKQGIGGPATVLTSSGGAGGGWYGGTVSNNTNGGAGGGSGYIGNPLLSNKHMTCYNCQSNTSESTYTNNTSDVSETATSDYAKNGNGYVRITFIKMN